MKRIAPFIIVVSLIGMLFTTSCGHKKVKYRLAQIDTLTILLDKTELMLNEINNDSITAMLKEVQQKNEAIYPVSHTKLNMKERSDYFQFTSVEKQFKSYLNDHIKNLDELKLSRKQITDLKTDVENHAIKDKKFDEYYLTENTSVNTLFNMVKSSLYKLKQNTEKYNLFNPIITKLMNDKKIKVETEGAKKSEKEAEGEEDD